MTPEMRTECPGGVRMDLRFFYWSDDLGAMVIINTKAWSTILDAQDLETMRAEHLASLLDGLASDWRLATDDEIDAQIEAEMEAERDAASAIHGDSIMEH